MRIIWAFHDTEPAGGAVGPNSLPQHGVTQRGAQSLYLVQRADQESPSPDETARVWELRNPAVEPPAFGESLYWCRVFRIPTMTRKHHLIRVSHLIFSSIEHWKGVAYNKLRRSILEMWKIITFSLLVRFLHMYLILLYKYH